MVLVYTSQCVRGLSYNLSSSRAAREHQCKDCAKANYHPLSSKLTMHWDIKALVFRVIDDLDRCLFLHSSPVSNNSSSGLASPCSASLHHFHTSSDISFQTGLCRELSPHLSCSFQGVSVSDSNPCLDVFLLALFFVPFCIWTCSILPALLSLQVSVLRTPHRTLSLCGSSDTDSNWLKAICLQMWPLATVQSGVWQWQCNFHTL